ncbi:phosphoenolpyruvate synthase [Actinomadura atramentaria]|uniref:phosphoenolpyruvate synthase n=1 Tax=Actinomadura atramentaria TaxID=1990 RepID=UPI0003805B15|nr:phosphoenolpyruvate synthase [Actinomadura atramentaria]
MAVLSVESSEDQVRRLAGGKGRNLFELTRSGAAVPPWAVVGSDVFAAFLADAGLADRLAALFAGVGLDGAAEAAAAAAELVRAAPVPPAAAAAVREAYARVGGGPVAVRSSGADEDGAELSYAGQFSSFLNVEGLDDVVDRVRACWASAYSARSVEYRVLHGLPPAAGGLAVVVQRLVPADASGVAFTADPVTGRADEYLVSAVYGLGEGLVSGAVDADTLVLAAADGAVLRRTVGEKAERVDPAPDGSGCAVSPVPDADRGRLALEPARVEAVWKAARRVTDLFGAPQDIEWCFADGELWILQSRPITALAPPRGELHVWDNSNIIESFNGVVSPLTYTFAKGVYARVYGKYAEALGVPRAQLEQMDEWLSCMLGYFHGRVYYNLLHWYRMVRIAPFYRMNRKVFEKTLGVSESLEDELADELRPFTFDSRPRAAAHAVRSGALFAWRFAVLRISVNRFLKMFSEVYADFERADPAELTADEAFRLYQRLERELLDRWGPMMVIEASILPALGVLHVLSGRWLPDAPEWFLWAVCSPKEDLESAGPAYRMEELAATARADARLRALIEETPDGETYEALRDAGYDDFLREIDAYIKEYGYRSIDELKLEVPDLREEPSGFFPMLRSALPGTRNAPRSDAAERYLDDRLGGPRRWAYEIVRRKVRHSLRDRERVRFARTRAFGMAKRLLRQTGRDLARRGVLEDWRDVFLLRMDELRGCFDGTVAHTEIPFLVRLRRERQEADRDRRAPSRFRTRGPVHARGNLDAWEPGGAAAGADGDELVGIASCPGRVEGTAKVVEKPHDLDGDILVAYRTDPGWVAVLPTASALLIERGSPVTHVAIVARELGVPTIVQIPRLTDRVKTGMRLSVDGATGRVRIIEGAD